MSQQSVVSSPWSELVRAASYGRVPTGSGFSLAPNFRIEVSEVWTLKTGNTPSRRVMKSAKIPPTAVGGSFKHGLRRSPLLAWNPTHGSGWIVQFQPSDHEAGEIGGRGSEDSRS